MAAAVSLIPELQELVEKMKGDHASLHRSAQEMQNILAQQGAEREQTAEALQKSLPGEYRLCT